MKHVELKQGDIVLFKKLDDSLGKEYYYDGNVIYVDDKNKKVAICYLDGYKSESEDFPYEKVVAKYDSNGEFMRFENYSGKSILLKTE